MYIRALIPCDAILENGDTTFDLRRAGITHLMAPSYPARSVFAILLRLELDDAEADEVHWVRVTIDHLGRELFAAPAAPMAIKNRIAGQPSYMNFFMRFRLVLNAPGELTVRVQVDNEVVSPTMRLYSMLLSDAPSQG
jgi:hypothetical protein